MTNPNDPITPSSRPLLLGEGIDFGASPFGLTKREIFAAMAMQGIISSPAAPPSDCSISLLAVLYADALITELNKETK